MRREAGEDSEQEPVFQRPWLVWAACGSWCVWKPEDDSDSPGREEESLACTGWWRWRECGKCSDSRFVLTVELAELAEGLVWGGRGNRGNCFWLKPLMNEDGFFS